MEIALRTDRELDIALKAMLSHGMHVNVSIDDLSKAQMNDLLYKVNFYLPYIIPFSFSSPFSGEKTFDGLCARNYFRAETRQLTSLRERNGVLILEFRGFDACGDKKLLTSLLQLFRGLLIDRTLIERSALQDAELVKRSSLYGFSDETIRHGGLKVLNAAKAALEEEFHNYEYLETMLQTNQSYAARIPSQIFSLQAPLS